MKDKEEFIVPVYEKDLHQQTFTYTIRVDSDDIFHGDTLKVTVEKVDIGKNKKCDENGLGEEIMKYYNHLLNHLEKCWRDYE